MKYALILLCLCSAALGSDEVVVTITDPRPVVLDLTIFVQSPVKPHAGLADGFVFVNTDHWGDAAKRMARSAMVGVPETPCGHLHLYRVFPGTEFTDQLLLYPEFKSFMHCVVDVATGKIDSVDFYINRRRSKLSEIKALVVRMRAELGIPLIDKKGH